MADLSKNVNDAFGGYRAEALDQRFSVDSFKQLHRVIERAFLSHTKVEQGHGVRRSELCDDLRFTLKSPS